MIAVTKLTSMLHKEGLLFWANKIGLKGISLSEFRIDSSKKGINIHESIKNYLKNGVPFEGQTQLDLCLADCEIISVEEKINNGFIVAIPDLLVRKNGKKIVVDFKSSNEVYLEQKLQTSTYKEMLGFDEVAIVNFTEWKFNVIQIDTKKYFDIVRFLYKIYTHLNDLNEKI